MVDVKVHTNALICALCDGEIVHITINEFHKYHICSGCGRIHNDSCGSKTMKKAN